jgi:predicted acetyltransferase
MSSTCLKTAVIRRQLTQELARVGGHIGYHVVPSHRRRGHAGRMLAGALASARTSVCVERCSPASRPTRLRKIFETNARQPDGVADGELRYWIPTSADR